MRGLGNKYPTEFFREKHCRWFTLCSSPHSSILPSELWPIIGFPWCSAPSTWLSESTALCLSHFFLLLLPLWCYDLKTSRQYDQKVAGLTRQRSPSFTVWCKVSWEPLFDLSSVLVASHWRVNLVLVTVSWLEVETQLMNLNETRDISNLIH